MTKKETEPVRQAYQEIPPAWYESIRNAFLLVGGAFYPSLVAEFVYMRKKKGWSRLAVTGLYVLSAIADRVSTAKCFDAAEKLEQVGIDGYIVRETNPLLPKKMTSKELMYNPRLWITDTLSLAIGVAFRPAGISWSIGRFYAAANNFRKARRINRMVELAEIEKPQPPR